MDKKVSIVIPAHASKVCTRCKIEKSLSDFYNRKNTADKRDSWCKSCCSESSKEYRKSHPEKYKKSYKDSYRRNKDKIYERNKVYVSRNKDKVNVWYRNRGHKLKTSFLEMYGGKCQCCGETESVFLSIDHINGQVGNSKKETGESAYRRAIKMYNPNEFRVLCHNCNMATRFGRTCPHQVQK